MARIVCQTYGLDHLLPFAVQSYGFWGKWQSFRQLYIGKNTLLQTVHCTIRVERAVMPALTRAGTPHLPSPFARHGRGGWFAGSCVSKLCPVRRFISWNTFSVISVYFRGFCVIYCPYMGRLGHVNGWKNDYSRVNGRLLVSKPKSVIRILVSVHFFLEQVFVLCKGAMRAL